MKKSKLFFGLALVCVTSVSAFLPKQASAGVDVQWQWATLANVQGIAVCDGPADNCTKPAKSDPKPQPDPVQSA